MLLDLQKTYPDTFSFLQLDVTDNFETIAVKAKQAAAVWGRIDVIVNNAGYSIVGTVEEAGFVLLPTPLELPHSYVSGCLFIVR